MNSWKEHWAFSSPFLIIGLIIVYSIKNFNFNFNYIFSLFLILFLSPLIMDIDHRQGKVKEAIIFLGLTILTIGITGILLDIVVLNLLISGLLLANIGFFISYVTKHRGFVHSIAFTLILSFVVYGLTKNLGLAILNFMGMYSHLIGDKIPFKIF